MAIGFYMIPILGILVSAAVIGIIFFYQYKKRQLQSQEIMAAIKEGVDVPLPEPHRRDPRQSGITLVSVGIALIIALYVWSGIELAVWGLILVAWGVAQLLSARQTSKEEG